MQQHPQQPFGYGPPPGAYGGYHQQPPYGGYPMHPHQPPQQRFPPQPHPQQFAPPPQPQAAPGVPYIGARISLVSNMNIRYEGTLYTIDTKASTVALQNVRCFGTEQRGSDGHGGGGFVPPSNDIYEFIIFGGKDIKDLAVLQAQEPAPLQDPAILSQQAPPPVDQPQQQEQQQPEPAQAGEPQQPASQQSAPQQPQQQQRHQGGDRAPRGGRGPQQRGGHQGQQGGAKHTVRVLNEEQPRKAQQPAWGNASASVSAVTQPPPAASQHHGQTIEESKAEFDFGASNARFEKIEAKHDDSVPSYDLPSADAGLDTSGFPAVKKAYDKTKSFFDDLTTDKSGPRQEVDRGNVRRVDSDTFGDEARSYRSKHSRGGGRRRGGGGGQGRQGGQGGNQWRQGGQGGQ